MEPLTLRIILKIIISIFGAMLIVGLGEVYAGGTSPHSSHMEAASGPSVASVMLLLLARAGYDFSVPESELKQWLVNRQFTPYPSLSDALLLFMEGKRLRKPVYLDVIVWNYEHAPGATSPRDVSQVDFSNLKSAVIEAYNKRYGEHIADFKSIIE